MVLPFPMRSAADVGMSLQVVVPGTFRLVFHFMHHKVQRSAAGVGPVDVIARRLQIQERLTMQIKDCIQETLDPLGVMVVIEAQHMCMQMRGVEKQNSLTTTSDFTGFFQQAKTREEFMNLIKHNR